MAIYIDEQKNFYVVNKQYKLSDDGRQISGAESPVLWRKYRSGRYEPSFRLSGSGIFRNPYEAGNERDYSLDSRPQEYSTNGVGDYRINSVSVINADGSDAADWRYAGYTIEKGKYAIPGMPALYGEEKDADT